MTKFIALLMLGTFTFAPFYAHAREDFSDFPYEKNDHRLYHLATSDISPELQELIFLGNTIKAQILTVISRMNVSFYIAGIVIIPVVFMCLLPYSPVAAMVLGLPAEIALMHYTAVHTLFSNEKDKMIVFAPNFLVIGLFVKIALTKLDSIYPHVQPLAQAINPTLNGGG